VAERAVDDEAELGRRRRGAARGEAIPARGKARAGLDQAVEQGAEVRKLRAQGIGSGWCG
jgi:hypothetical protein